MISGIRFSAHGLYPVYELFFLILGWVSLGNDDGDGDGDGDEKGKKNNRLRLAKQLCTCIMFARASRFFVHFFAFVTRLRRETA